MRYTRLPHDMRRTILLLMLGLFCTALSSAAITVYIFHDVDKDMIGHWNEAFAGLCIESVLFTVVVGGGVALLTLLGRHIFRLKGYSPRAKLGLFLGIGVTVFQYPWDFVGRAAFPKLADSSLFLSLIVAIVLCSIVIVRDNFKQMKLCTGAPQPALSEAEGSGFFRT
jgi:cell division protein FtsL